MGWIALKVVPISSGVTMKIQNKFTKGSQLLPAMGTSFPMAVFWRKNYFPLANGFFQGSMLR
jgi:hypothetical protein